MNKINYKKLLFAVLLIGFAAAGRYLLLDFPNVETMTVAILLASALLGGAYTLVVPLAAVAIFDLFYGNNSILIFTWSAWAIIGFFGLVLKGRTKSAWKFTAGLTGMGMVASLFFYFWTNFGVWLIGSWYPKTANGLLNCFIAGIPFLKWQIIGNLIIVPVAGLAFHFLYEKIRIAQSKPLFIPTPRTSHPSKRG